MMLTDPKEIEIISRARQKNVRDHKRSRQHFVNIYDDFLQDVEFNGSRVIDLGPGQYDFGVLATQRGASEIVGVDNDVAVLELGEHKGFHVKEGRIQDINSDWFGKPFDGVFCKFALNCFWFWEDAPAQLEFVDRVASLVKPEGWAWIAPWNGAPKSANLGQSDIAKILDRQASQFKKHGFDAFNLTPELAVRYGVNGVVANNAIFLKRLPLRVLSECKSL
ncbi:MAG: methyltransferase domain-containing protein [Gammaproteobacteria bacterium]|nr:methyltransferase domain-containing protein [Gammaproteobacteria bacterium]